jgi:hypothetical protein
VLIRTRVNEIREMSRATQGVTLINLGPEEKLAGLQKVVDADDADVPGIDANGEEAETPDDDTAQAPPAGEPGTDDGEPA